MNMDYAIEVKDVYKTFDVYLDKANSLKEKMLFWTNFLNLLKKSCKYLGVMLSYICKKICILFLSVIKIFKYKIKFKEIRFGG